jgi:hypothetical protein
LCVDEVLVVVDSVAAVVLVAILDLQVGEEVIVRGTRSPFLVDADLPVVDLVGRWRSGMYMCPRKPACSRGLPQRRTWPFLRVSSVRVCSMNNGSDLIRGKVSQM